MSAEAGQFSIGAEVVATDGPCGKLTALIIDPIAQAITHLIVTPRRHHGMGRQVPVELVDSAGESIRLNCDRATFDALDDAEEIHFVPVSGDNWGYGGGALYSSPHYGLGLVAGMGAGGMGDIGHGSHGTPHPVESDRVPAGEVEVRRGDEVHARDGWIGSVKGLVVDPADNHVTHVLLQEGHFWGRKQVAIPVGSTARVEDEIRVDLTKQEIEDLPEVTVSSSPGG